MSDILYRDEAFNIVGAAMAVHRHLGCGFSEKVYQEALELEFQQRGIQYVRESPVHAVYNGVQLKTEFIPDFICYDSIVVEIKAVRELDDMHRSQAINYAKVLGVNLSLLINFGQSSLVYERFVV